MQSAIPVLSLSIWLPIIGGLFVLASGDKVPGISRWTALGFSILTFLISLLLWTGFESGTAQMQFVEHATWIPGINAWYYLGVDGISMPLIVLTTFITILVVIAGWEVIRYKPSQYMAAFLMMEGVMIGVFTALDAVLFYVFWEAMLIPMFIIIGVWGGPNRVYATIKFFLYTFFGSVFMLVALIYMYFKSGSYSILDFQQLPLSLTEQVWIFLAFLAAFAVKVPMWPVHTWLPDAHVEAPTGGSGMLAAIMLKIGGYGFLRFSLPITPDASATLDWLIIAMSLIAVVYIGFVALVQQDMKKLIAYSSIAHMGFVTLGFFIVFAIFNRPEAVGGAVLGMAGGMYVLGGIVAGPAIAITGFMMATKAEEALTKSWAYKSEVDKKIAEIGGMRAILQGLQANAKEMTRTLEKLVPFFDDAVNNLSADDASFQRLLAVGKGLKLVLETPIMEKDGGVTQNLESDLRAKIRHAGMIEYKG